VCSIIAGSCGTHPLEIHGQGPWRKPRLPPDLENLYFPVGGGATPCGLDLWEAEGVVLSSWEQWEEGTL